MYEVDFLAIEKEGEQGTKSGDAITVRFSDAQTGHPRIVVIDGGYAYKGSELVEHIRRQYRAEHIDLIISTHPDQDHLNGLAAVLDEISVGEVFIHRPHLHCGFAEELSNIEVVDAIIGLAEDQGIPVTEPFAGVTRFNNQVRIIGPTQQYYEDLLDEQFAQNSPLSQSALRGRQFLSSYLSKSSDLLSRILDHLPIETLGEDGQTSPRNNSSAITLITVDNTQLLFTGDAGIPALSAAWDARAELVWPDFAELGFFQVPHHGSRRNLSPSLLNKMFGPPSQSTSAVTAFVSSAAGDGKHPSPKVTNALKRRGLAVYATESRNLLHHSGELGMRDGYSNASPIEPLAEDDI